MPSSSVFRLVSIAALASVALAGCAHRTRSGAADIPGFMQGTFIDDYDNRYTISMSEWQQHPALRYHVVHVEVGGAFLIARNDATNRTDPGRWTRIDWVQLNALPPYEWGFCYSAWQAPTRAVAETVSVARPEQPRTGCNGYPYTRMRPAPGSPPASPPIDRR